MRICPECSGAGYYAIDHYSPGSRYGHRQTEHVCETCQGEGMLNEETIQIGNLTIYYVQNEQGLLITYAEQAGKPYLLDDEEAEELTTAIEEITR